MLRARLWPGRPLVIFTLMAVSISWIFWLPVAAADHHVGHVDSSATPLLIVLGTFGPLLAALSLVARTSGFGGVRAFISQAFRWRVGLRWYAAAFLAPAAIRLVVLYLHVLRGGTVADLDESSRWLAVPATFLWVLLIGGPVGEEFGWRGYLLPQLQSRIGMLRASLAIGAIAAIWHLPLFFIAGTTQSHLPFLLFAARTVALSIVSTWLYNGSRRSLLLVLLFHASLNTWPNTLYVLEAEGNLGPYISTTVIYAGWAAMLAILGLLRGRGYRREEPEAFQTLAA